MSDASSFGKALRRVARGAIVTFLSAWMGFGAAVALLSPARAEEPVRLALLLRPDSATDHTRLVAATDARVVSAPLALMTTATPPDALRRITRSMRQAASSSTLTAPDREVLIGALVLVFAVSAFAITALWRRPLREFFEAGTRVKRPD